MKRSEFIKKSAITSGLILANQFPISALGKSKNTSLTILHTNDVHSRLDPFPMDGSKYQGMGGVANRKKVIDEIRTSDSNILLFDSGDIFQGTPYFNQFKGEVEMKVMSALGYDAGTMGNHDFDAGIDNFAQQLTYANFPIVVCNYDFKYTSLENKIHPYTIIKKGGLKIGVIGIGIQLQGLVSKELSGETVYQNPIEKANKYAAILKHNKKCDMVVCLSHLGFEYKDNKISDKILAKETANIDLILGGHTHTFLDEPFQAKNKEGQVVLINQVGWAGIQLGYLNFDFSHQKGIDVLLKSHTGIYLEKTSV